MKDTTLFIIPGACSFGSMVALEWLAKPYQVGITTPEIRSSKEFKTINPLGKVGALKDGDNLVAENIAILLYLVDSNPDSVINIPLNTQERVEAYKWLSYLSSTLHVAFGPLFRPSAYVEESAVEMFTKYTISRLKDVLAYVDSYLAANKFFIGDKVSIVDAQAYGLLRWSVKFNVLNDDYPAIKNFLQQMEQLPVVQNALNIEEQKTENLSNSSFAGYYKFA